jgi:hypothetical protein
MAAWISQGLWTGSEFPENFRKKQCVFTKEIIKETNIKLE